jgi:hypothetical protein
MPREETQPSSPGSRTFNWTGKGLITKQLVTTRIKRVRHATDIDSVLVLRMISVHFNVVTRFCSKHNSPAAFRKQLKQRVFTFTIGLENQSPRHLVTFGRPQEALTTLTICAINKTG